MAGLQLCQVQTIFRGLVQKHFLSDTRYRKRFKSISLILIHSLPLTSVTAAITDLGGNHIDTTSAPSGENSHSLDSQSNIEVDSIAPESARLDSLIVLRLMNNRIILTGPDHDDDLDGIGNRNTIHKIPGDATFDWSKFSIKGTDRFGNETDFWFTNGDVVSTGLLDSPDWAVAQFAKSRYNIDFTSEAIERLKNWDGFSTFADDMTVTINEGWLMD